MRIEKQDGDHFSTKKAKHAKMSPTVMYSSDLSQILKIWFQLHNSIIFASWHILEFSQPLQNEFALLET
jgi:hypothetical protein